MKAECFYGVFFEIKRAACLRYSLIISKKQQASP
ncbi:hypothetical protein B14911_10112 [Bacillus sp. NRRL B-14911]|nr:hypothetical protein B14911_10112 [Bacillus sp. NRRL B-14911]